MRAARRIRLNPHLRAAVRASGTPLWRITAVIGCVHQSKLSQLLHAVALPDNARSVRLVYALADSVNFPRSLAFLDEPIDGVRS